MRSSSIGRMVLIAGLNLLSMRAATGQSAYLAGGVPPPVLEGGGSRGANWFGTAGNPGRKGIGFRVSGAETASRLWLSADLTLQPGTPRRVRPYGFLGGGVVVDLSESDPVLTVGGDCGSSCSG